MNFTRDALMYVGLQWNKTKCVLVHVNRGCLSQTSDGVKIGDSGLRKSLKPASFDKIPGSYVEYQAGGSLSVSECSKSLSTENFSYLD